MKKLIVVFLFFLVASVYAQEACAPCDCGTRTQEIKASDNSTSETVEKAGIAVGAAAIGAALVKKFSCERFDIIIEYKLMDACLNSCSGVASLSARTEKCAKAIQNMECKKKLGAAEISTSISNSCPL